MDNRIDALPHGKLLCILLILGYVFLMLGNGMVSLTHPDEVFYAQTAKEMISHNSWMTPFIFDHPQFEKPILFFLMLKILFLGFGIAPLVARFWPSFFGMVGVITVYGITFMLFERKKTAFLAGIVLVSSFFYVALSRAVLTDMVFSILVMISIGFFYFAYRYPARKDAGLILCLIFAGLAVLTKGLLGFLLPAGIAGGYLFSLRDLKFLKCRGIFWGLMIFILMTLPWHLLMVKLYGKTFLWEYVYNIHIRRLIEAEHPKCDTWYFYPGVLLGGTLPWALFVFPAFRMLFQTLRRKGEEAVRLFFPLVWMGVVFMHVQPAHSKLASYILPAFPVMAILIAYYFTRTTESGTSLPRGIKIFGYLLSGLLGVCAAGSVVFAQTNLDFVGSPVPFYIFAGLLVFCALAISWNLRRDRFFGAVYSTLGVTLSLLVLLSLGRPYAEPWVSCKEICDIFNEKAPSQSVILTSKFYARGVRYYTNRPIAVIDINGSGFFSPHPIPFLNSPTKVRDFLNIQPVTYGIVKKGDYEYLQGITAQMNLKISSIQEIGGKRIIKIEH